MAERPSVEEILARVRAAGAAKPAEKATDAPKPEVPAEEAASVESMPEEPDAPTAEPESKPPASPKPTRRPLTLQEKLAAARSRPVEAEPEAAPTPTSPPSEAEETAGEPSPTSTPSKPEAPRRPLTLQEKLAAARSRPTGTDPASPAPAKTTRTPSESKPTADEPVSEDVAEPATSTAPKAPRRPLTLKEKLAAARAGSGGATTTPAAKPSTTDKPATESPETEAAMEVTARPLPPLEAMTDPKDLAEAARRAGAEKEKRSRAATETKPTTRPRSKRIESRVVPPRPERPETEPSAETEPSIPTETRPEGVILGLVQATRRQLMRTGFWIAVGWSTFAAGLAAFVAMSLRYMFPNILAEPPSTIKVGLPSNFESGEVNEAWKGEWGFWIVRSDNYDGEEKIYALSTICTHLGCPPNWLASEQKFKCPCHGSGFYISGVNFEGPAPRPLERYKVSIGDDGQIVVDKSIKFQEELHQWSDPESFINV